MVFIARNRKKVFFKGSLFLSVLVLTLFVISPKVQIDDASYGAEALEPLVSLAQVKHPTGSYLNGNLIHTELSLFNPSKATKIVRLVWNLSNAQGKEVATQTISVTCQPMQTTPVDLPWLLSEELATGHYFTTVELYSGTNFTALQTDLSSTLRTGFHGVSEGFWLFKRQTTGESLATDNWIISDKQLGKSKFKPEHVGIAEGQLALELPAGTTDGAEIWTQSQQSYGTYAVRMKLPNAPGSITGFFLYSAPDYYNEIDIELYNQPDSTLMLTTYADGDRQNSFEKNLLFDPTADYHEYLIDYRPEGLSFYVDGKWQKTWAGGYSHNPMYLMVNVWYPNWLEGSGSTESKKLLIEWIRWY